METWEDIIADEQQDVQSAKKTKTRGALFGILGSIALIAILGFFVWKFVLPIINKEEPAEAPTTAEVVEEETEAPVETVDPVEETILQKEIPNAPEGENRERTVTVENNQITDGENTIELNGILLGDPGNNCTVINRNDYCIAAYNLITAEPTNDETDNEETSPTAPITENIDVYYFNDIVSTRIFGDNPTITSHDKDNALYYAETTITNSEEKTKTAYIIVNEDASGWLITLDTTNNDIITDLRERITVM